MRTSKRRFRFAVRAGDAATAKDLAESARRAEALGYSAMLFTDHYVGAGPAMSAANHPIQPFAAIPAATAAALVTTDLTVGFRVLCVDFHNPVVLAKELATIDVLSGGRLEVGLGAGWIETEYDAMNVAFDRPGVRIRRLGEVVEVLKQCFKPGQVVVEGTSGVRASGFEGTPAPIQPGGPPIAIGGGGRKVLTLAGQVADIACFNFNNAAGRLDTNGPRLSTADLTDERVQWVLEGSAGRADAVTHEISIAAAMITERPRTDAEQFTGFFGLPVDDVLKHPHALIGTVDSICESLIARRDRFGFSYITVRDRVMDEFAPVVARLAGT